MEQSFTKEDLIKAYKQAWKADKTLYNGIESFNKWFKIEYITKPTVFKVKDLEKYKPSELEE